MNKKANLLTGIKFLASFTIILFVLSILFYEEKKASVITCLVVQHEFNKMVDVAKEYRQNGTVPKKRAAFEERLEEYLKHNNKLNCNFNEKVIRASMQF